jgi:rhodanese-related sulfurtransferase
MNKKMIAAVATVIALGIGGIFLLAHSDASASRSLPAGDFLARYRNTPNAVLIDVRTPAEFRAGHIEGATILDFEDASFGSEIRKLDAAKTYFVYCRSGNRSGQAITKMKNAGISNIFELQGGIVSNQGALTLVAS